MHSLTNLSARNTKSFRRGNCTRSIFSDTRACLAVSWSLAAEAAILKRNSGQSILLRHTSLSRSLIGLVFALFNLAP